MKFIVRITVLLVVIFSAQSSFAAFSLSGSTITQSGTDTDLSGLTSVAGVNIINQGTGESEITIYDLGNLQLKIEGALTQNPEKEMIIFNNPSNPIVDIRSGGVYNMGIDINPGTFAERQSIGTAIYVASADVGCCNANQSAIAIQNGATWNWKGATVDVAQLPFYSSPTSIVNITNGVLLVNRNPSSSNIQIRQTSDFFNVDGFRFIGNGLDDLTFLRRPQSMLNYQPENLSGAIAFSGNTPNYDVTLQGYSGGGLNVQDIKFWQGARPILINSKTGSNIIAGAHQSHGNSYGVALVKQEFNLNIQDASGSNIEGAQVYIKDTDNGNREKYSKEGHVVDNTEDNIYLLTTDTNGDIPTTEILLAANVANSGNGDAPNTGNYAWDYRGKNNNDTDLFDAHVWSYEHQYQKIVDIEMKGVDGTGVKTKLLQDQDISETDQSVVGSYSTIDTLDELYNRAKLWKINNVSYPDIETALAENNGGVLDLSDHDLIIDKNATSVFEVDETNKTITIKSDELKFGSIFETLTTTGTVSFLSGAIQTFDYTDATGSYVIDDVIPVITITAPTKIKNGNITDTTINITDDRGIMAANVSVGSTTTLAFSGFTCSQVTATEVNCTIVLASSGNLAIEATDVYENTSVILESGYDIDSNSVAVSLEQDLTQVDPTNSGTFLYKVVFSKPIDSTTFITSDLDTSLSYPANPANPFSVSVDTITEIAPNDGTTFEIEVSAIDSGTIILNMPAGVVSDSYGNENLSSGSIDNSVVYIEDTTSPVITITSDISSKLDDENIPVTITITDNKKINADSISINTNFTTAGVSGFTCLQKSITEVSCTLSVVNSGSISIDAIDFEGNSSVQSDNNYVIDATDPTVSIIQSSTQSDPTTSLPIFYTVTFSKPIDSTTFITSDLDTSLSYPANPANPFSVSVDTITEIAPNDGTTFEIEVSAIDSGTIILNMPAGVVSDVAGNTNTSSSTTDNQVIYKQDTDIPVISITSSIATKLNGAFIPVTVTVTDNKAIDAGSVTVNVFNTTAGVGSYSCNQTSVTQVDCSFEITSSGSVTIDAIDFEGNNSTQTDSGYFVDLIAPDLTASVSIENPYSNASPLITFSATDNLTNPEDHRFEVSIDNAPFTVQTSPYNPTLSSSNHKIVIRAYDEVGNYSDEIIRFSPLIVIQSPTNKSNTDITDTIITLASPNDIDSVSITGAGSNFTCTPSISSAPIVSPIQCTGVITETGTLAVSITDAVTTSILTEEYVIETGSPVIEVLGNKTRGEKIIEGVSFTVTDDLEIDVSGVSIYSSTTAGYRAFSCTQISGTEINCVFDVTYSGDLVINAFDVSGNLTQETIKYTITYPKGGGGGSRSIHVCYDPKAVNYTPNLNGEKVDFYGNYDACIYKIEPVLEGEKCSPSQIITQNLKAGDRNGKYSSWQKETITEVKILQEHMNRLGFNAGPVDGILGPLTDAAIKRMQLYLGTIQDGYVGPKTRALINNSCSADGNNEPESTTKEQDVDIIDIYVPNCTITYSRLIKYGVVGEDVKQVQICMNSLGYSTGAVDGWYGENTYHGITAYQRENGLKYIDGIVGPETSKSLNNL